MAVAGRLGIACATTSPDGFVCQATGAGLLVPGDNFVYYALRGDISRVVAIGKVVDDVFYDRSREEDPGWPWLVPVEIEAKKHFIGEGFPLERSRCRPHPHAVGTAPFTHHLEA